MAGEVRILGAEEVRRRLEQMAKSIQQASAEDVVVGTAVEYAPGMEYGRHPGGKLARRAGGTFALTDALETVRPDIAPAVAAALAEGRPAADALLAAGFQVEALTKTLLTQRLYNKPVPRTKRGKPKWRRTGNLRASYHTAPARGGV